MTLFAICKQWRRRRMPSIQREKISFTIGFLDWISGIPVDNWETLYSWSLLHRQLIQFWQKIETGTGCFHNFINGPYSDRSYWHARSSSNQHESVLAQVYTYYLLPIVAWVGHIYRSRFINNLVTGKLEYRNRLVNSHEDCSIESRDRPSVPRRISNFHIE